MTHKSTPKTTRTTAFSEFFRSASSRDKKRTYSAVIKSASEAQAKVIEKAQNRAQ